MFQYNLIYQNSSGLGFCHRILLTPALGQFEPVALGDVVLACVNRHVPSKVRKGRIPLQFTVGVCIRSRW